MPAGEHGVHLPHDFIHSTCCGVPAEQKQGNLAAPGFFSLSNHYLHIGIFKYYVVFFRQFTSIFIHFFICTALVGFHGLL